MCLLRLYRFNIRFFLSQLQTLDSILRDFIVLTSSRLQQLNHHMDFTEEKSNVLGSWFINKWVVDDQRIPRQALDVLSCQMGSDSPQKRKLVDTLNATQEVVRPPTVWILV
jgi:hypothetical protein